MAIPAADRGGEWGAVESLHPRCGTSMSDYASVAVSARGMILNDPGVVSCSAESDGMQELTPQAGGC